MQYCKRAPTKPHRKIISARVLTAVSVGASEATGHVNDEQIYFVVHSAHQMHRWDEPQCGS